MVSLNRLTKKKLGEILLEQGLITEEQIQDALRLQNQQGVLFGEALVDQGIISEEKIVSTLLHQFGLPYLEPSNYEIPQELMEIFDPTMMRRYQFVPVDSIGSVLVVAIAGMLSEDLLGEMESQTGCTVHLYLTKMSEIHQVLERFGI